MLTGNNKIYYGSYVLLYIILIIPITYGFVPANSGAHEWLDRLEVVGFGFVTQLLGRGVTYAVFQLGIHFVTLVLTAWFFSYLLERHKDIIACTVLYVTCPFRFYVCYKSLNFGAIVVWMLLPIIAYCMMKVGKVRGKKQYNILCKEKYVYPVVIVSAMYWVYMCNRLF